MTDLLYEWIEELEEFIEGHYQFVRKTQFFGRSEEEYISEKLYRDYEEVCFSKLQRRPEALKEMGYDQVQQWFGHVKIDIRNFQSENDTNHNYQTSELVIPYFRQLINLLEESLQVWKRWDFKGNPISSGIFQHEDLQYQLRSEALKKEIKDYILKELKNFQERLHSDIQYYEAHPYLLDINDPSCLSETQRLFFEFEKDPSLHEKYLAFPEVLLDELVEELGLSYTFLEIKIPIVLDKERWTEEDKKDESIAYDYLLRKWWFEQYEEYPEEE